MKDNHEPTPLESLFQESFPDSAGAVDAFATEPETELEVELETELDSEPEAELEVEIESAEETETSIEAAEEENDTAPELSYEELVRELEKIVRSLESGDITLDQSMALFARGIELSRQCQNQLDAIEKKITILIEGPDGRLAEQPFAVNNDE
jgi:exodeoxyribonuclease VII small subunit